MTLVTSTNWKLQVPTCTHTPPIPVHEARIITKLFPTRRLILHVAPNTKGAAFGITYTSWVQRIKRGSAIILHCTEALSDSHDCSANGQKRTHLFTLDGQPFVRPSYMKNALLVLNFCEFHESVSKRNHSPLGRVNTERCPAMLLFTAIAALLGLPEAKLHFRFEEHKYLGIGAWGYVLHAIQRRTGRECAVKIIPKPILRSARHRAAIAQEIQILRACNHPNIISFMESFQDEHNIYIVTEVFHGGTLEQYLKRGHRLCEGDALKLFGQLMQAVSYLHAKGICHRDLTLSNIGLNGAVLKLFDFGLSRWRQPWETMTSNEFHGTRAFWAPEMVAREKHVPEEAEIWACGIILLSMLVPEIQMSPRPAHLPEDAKTVLSSSLVRHVSVPSLWLLARMLHKDPEKRPNACEVLNELLQNQSLSGATAQEGLATRESPTSIMALSRGTMLFSPRLKHATKPSGSAASKSGIYKEGERP